MIRNRIKVNFNSQIRVSPIKEKGTKRSSRGRGKAGKGTGDLLEKVRTYVTKYRMFDPPDMIVVAVSGGPDSVCLLDLLFRLRKVLGVRLCVAHLNHELRGGASDGDARFVSRLAGKMDLPFHSGRCDAETLAKAEGRSVEDASRQARLRFLEEVRTRVGAARVALGHTRGDQAETVLLRLLRGSGRGGLGAMRPVRDGVWVRPLLEVSREEVLSYLNLRQLRFRRDASNRDTRFTRNRIRLDLIPRLRSDYNPEIEGILARTALLLGEEEAWLEEVVQRAFSRAKRHAAPGKIVLDIKRVLGYHIILQRRIIRKALFDLGSPGDGLAFEAVERVVNALNRTSFGIRSSEQIGIFRTSDALIFSRPLSPFEIPVRIPGRTLIPPLGITLFARIHSASGIRAFIRSASSDEAYLDLSSVEPGVILRNQRREDRVSPLGMRGTKRVNDLLADAKVHRSLRDSVPILASGGNIIWVVGHRLSHAARVTARTQRVVHFRVKPSRKSRTRDS